MPWYDVFWNYVEPDGNVEHIAANGLTPEDVNAVLMNPEETGISRSSGRLMRSVTYQMVAIFAWCTRK